MFLMGIVVPAISQRSSRDGSSDEDDDIDEDDQMDDDEEEEDGQDKRRSARLRSGPNPKKVSFTERVYPLRERKAVSGKFFMSR